MIRRDVHVREARTVLTLGTDNGHATDVEVSAGHASYLDVHRTTALHSVPLYRVPSAVFHGLSRCL